MAAKKNGSGFCQLLNFSTLEMKLFDVSDLDPSSSEWTTLTGSLSLGDSGPSQGPPPLAKEACWGPVPLPLNPKLGDDAIAKLSELSLQLRTPRCHGPPWLPFLKFNTLSYCQDSTFPTNSRCLGNCAVQFLCAFLCKGCLCIKSFCIRNHVSVLLLTIRRHLLDSPAAGANLCVQV